MSAGTKQLGARLELKVEERGEISAVVATLGVVDRDGDVLTAGAIPDGAKVKLSSYGHDVVFGAAPVGLGTLSQRGTRVSFDGRLFLTTSRGRETYETLKAMGPDQEWSFGFKVLDWTRPSDEWKRRGARRILTSLEAFEVSPVFRGAGIGTSTTAVKAACSTSGACSSKMPAEVNVDPLLRHEAERVARWCAVRWGLPAVPTLKFFSPSERPESRGVFFESLPHAIHVRADLRDERLIETVLHETSHLARHYHELPNVEAEVDHEAKMLAIHHHHETEAYRRWANYQY